MELKDIKSLSCEELCEEMKAMELPAYRGGQIFLWLHRKNISSFDEMLNIPLNIRKTLSEKYYIAGAAIEKKQISQTSEKKTNLMSQRASEKDNQQHGKRIPLI